MFSITCRAFVHRGEERLFISCPNDQSLNLALKLLPGIRWSKTHKQWHLPFTLKSHRQLCKCVEGIATIDPTGIKAKLERTFRLGEPTETSLPVVALSIRPVIAIKPPAIVSTVLRIAKVNAHVLPSFKQHLVLKAYSASTIRTYSNELVQFLGAAKNNCVDDFDPARIKKYLQYCFEKLNLTEHTLHSRINALKFYYEQVLRREKFFWEIPRPKKQLQLPNFFNKDEVAAILNSTQNLKHKTMLMLCYSTGLRVSEVVGLKTRNIDGKRMAILVQRAKGKKDRIVPLSPVLLVMLREYAMNYKPAVKGFLFAGQVAAEPYSVRSLQEVLHSAKAKARVYKQGGVHALRHSFATHLLDKGTDISMIQKLLGHHDIKTTLRYLHTTNRDILNVISPLDSLGLG